MSKELVLICNEDGKWQAYESDHSVVIVCANQEEQDRACEILSKIGTDDDLRDAIFTSPVAIAAKLKAYCGSKDQNCGGCAFDKSGGCALRNPPPEWEIEAGEVKEDVPDDRFDALAAPWARKIRAAFPAAFVNMRNELILIPKANTYIMLNQVRDERDFKAAILEDCSRNAFKECSRKLQDEHLDGINKLLDTKFTRDDMELIYTYLGNGIQHDLCLRFVASGYDLEVLREYDKKREAGSDGKT